jgi:hypothetical protein
MTKPSVNDVRSWGRRLITATRSDSTTPLAAVGVAGADDADAGADDDTDVVEELAVTVADEFVSSEHANNDPVMTNAASRRRIEPVTLPPAAGRLGLGPTTDVEGISCGEMT